MNKQAACKAVLEGGEEMRKNILLKRLDEEKEILVFAFTNARNVISNTEENDVGKIFAEISELDDKILFVLRSIGELQKEILEDILKKI